MKRGVEIFKNDHEIKAWPLKGIDKFYTFSLFSPVWKKGEDNFFSDFIIFSETYTTGDFFENVQYTQWILRVPAHWTSNETASGRKKINCL